MDPAAGRATWDAAVFWRLTINLPIREPPRRGEPAPAHADNALVLATSASGASIGEAPLPAEETILAWLGPGP
ncbi:MAG: hypothetical protein GY859_43340 [Desulfobacterales bacterium]|nr:hypothetical protein [Desulfobacterales bacterium]